MYLVILLHIIFSTYSFAYINIYPLTFDKRIDNLGEVQEFNLYNGTKEPLKYQIYIDDNTKNRDMSDWIEFYPKVITVLPGKEEVFKVFIQSPKGIKKGEYSAVLGVKELYFPNEDAMREKQNSFKIMTNLKLELFGFVGDIPSALEIENLTIEQDKKNLNLKGKIENSGERRGTFKFYLADSKNKNRFLVGEKRLLPGEEFSLKEFSQKIDDDEILKKLKRYKNFIIEENNKIVRLIKF